jgi:hypothetical protein
VKYLVEDMKLSEEIKIACAVTAVMYGQLDCLKYFVEEAKAPLDNWQYIAYARFTKSAPTAKTTCEKKGAQNQRTKTTISLSRKQKR